MSESDFARAERHSRQGGRRVARIATILERLNRISSRIPQTVAIVEKTLNTLQRILPIARDHSFRECQKR